MEHAEKHLKCAHVLVPLDELNPADFMAQHALAKDAPVYLLCRSGKRATQAAEKFMAAGYPNAQVIEGGIMACDECGYETEGHSTDYGAGTKPISLERQVRITAGLFAATGAFLGITLNPMFSMIPLAIGIGLAFSGITDRCGLALVLTRAPWNQTACSQPTRR